VRLHVKRAHDPAFALRDVMTSSPFAADSMAGAAVDRVGVNTPLRVSFPSPPFRK
jgi:hypothetical protein